MKEKSILMVMLVMIIDYFVLQAVALKLQLTDK